MIITNSASGVRWLPRISDARAERLAQAMAQQLGLPELLARVLVGRGVGLEEAQDFLHPTLRHFMPDPAHLKDMEVAAARIALAIERHEKVAVFGDYDVDGATSSALLIRYFAHFGQQLTCYIPDRMTEGYGPNKGAFDMLAAQGVKLVITVDCGTVAHEPLAHAHAMGIEVIVADHHMAEGALPPALAVVNPNRIDQESPCRHLAAVGVTFLLLVATNAALRLRHHDVPDLLQGLDLVALGTICDVVPLKSLNRAFVAQGLRVMAKRQNAGIRALYDITSIHEPPSAYHAGFLIGPRINAGGRVGESALGSQILSSEDPIAIREMAERLDHYNAERQAIEVSVLAQAEAQAEKQSNQPVIIAYGEGWHEGVIGIAAGRLKERYARPAIVMSVKDGIGKASARSVSGADIGAAVTAARLDGMLIAGGGHAMAAGFSLQMARLAEFTDFITHRLESAVNAYALERALLYDGLVDVAGITLALADQLERAAPYGMGNPAPRLVIPNARITRCERMKDAHLRLMLEPPGGGKWIKAVSFQTVDTLIGQLLESACNGSAHLAGSVKRQHWQGVESVQFHIEDAAPVD